MLLSGMSRRGAQGGQEGNWGQGSSLCLRHHTLASLPVLCFLPAPGAGIRAGGCAVLVRPQVLQKHSLGQGNSRWRGQCLCARSGTSGAFPLVLTGSVPLCLSFPPRLQRGCDLTWLPAWPPRFEFLLCACCAARKVLWESKYSSPRRLQPGCSLARRGAPGEGLRCCLCVLRPVPGVSAGTSAGGGSGGLRPIPTAPGCSASFHRCRTDPQGHGDPPSPSERGPRSSRCGPGVFCFAAGAAGLACGGEGRREEHSSHIYRLLPSLWDAAPVTRWLYDPAAQL